MTKSEKQMRGPSVFVDLNYRVGLLQSVQDHLVAGRRRSQHNVIIDWLFQEPPELFTCPEMIQVHFVYREWVGVHPKRLFLKNESLVTCTVVIDVVI